MDDRDLAERERVASRPSLGVAPLLLRMEISLINDGEAYGRRLRHVISAGLNVAHEQSFDVDELDSSGVPAWFSSVTGKIDLTEVDVPVESLHGRDLYYEQRGEDAWDLQEWLFSFDPDLRRWRWWDLTVLDAHRVNLWIDAKGEVVIPCEELRWAVFAAGADGVANLEVGEVGEWQRQSSVGLL